MPAPVGPPEKPFEENIYNIREKLDTLRTEVEKKISGEDEAAKELRFTNALTPVVTPIDQLRIDVEAKKIADPTFESTADFRTILDIYKGLVIKEFDAAPLTPEQVLKGLSDRNLEMADIDQLKTSDFKDEASMLEATRDAYEKILDASESVYDFIPAQGREFLDGWGVDRKSFGSMLLELIMSRLDKGFAGKYIKNIRQGMGLARAKNEGIDKVARDEGWRDWTKEYDAWLVRVKANPSSTEEAPDLYTFILGQKEFTDFRTQFTDVDKPNTLFGGIAHDQIELTHTGVSMIKEVSPWKFLLSYNDLERDDSASPSVYSLKSGSTAENLEKVYLAIQAAPGSVTQISVGNFQLNDTKLVAKIEGDMNDSRLKNALELKPNAAAYNSVIINSNGGIAAPSADPTAELKGGVLSVSYAALDDNTRSIKLFDASKTETGDKKYDWDATTNTWTVT